MTPFTLSEEQEAALRFFYDFVENKPDTVAVIKGEAGTGKTTIMKYASEWLTNKEIENCFVAPTNKAAIILTKSTNKQVKTLHKLLGLSPNLNLINLDLKNLEFIRKNKDLPRNSVIICDEGSMINDDLYNLLEELAKKANSKILFVLDEAQLAPVKNEDKSLTTKCTNSYSLTKVFRQSTESIIMPIIKRLRIENILHFEDLISDNEELRIINSRNQFANFFIKTISEEVSKSKVITSKIFAFTNKQVNEYNLYCHYKLFGRDNLFNVGEQIIFRSTNDTYEVVNAQDAVITDVKNIEVPIPNVGEYPGYLITCLKSDDTKSIIPVLSEKLPEEDKEEIAEHIETIRSSAVNATAKKTKNKFWARYFEIVNSFFSMEDFYYDGRLVKERGLAYGYAMTVHLSQGSTYQNSFIDIDNINLCRDNESARQLKYVAFSRTRKNIYIYDKK